MAGHMRLLRVISGGQTGVDRAALDAAIEFGVPTGGWCPKGRRAEDGYVPHRYPMEETPSRDYSQRTRWNVRDSDATLVLTLGELSGGSLLTTQIAAELGKPCLVVELDRYDAPSRIVDFIEGNLVKVLNVAGPRESRSPVIHARAKAVLLQAFRDGEGPLILR